jgi:hypothetical protein
MNRESIRAHCRSRRKFPLALVAVAPLLCGLSSPAFGRVKLITLPVRERVEIQLDNAGATLVEEERVVPLVAGENQIDFSWANTQIDPNTIVFRVVAPLGAASLDVKVLSVSYPPNEASLVWKVGASASGAARVRISYLLGRLTKSFNYRALASHDETTLRLSQFMRLENLANEEFGSTGLWAGFGPRFLKPVGVNETKEMLVETFADVPIKKTYTCNPQEFGYLDQPQNKLRVPMHYVLKNDKAHRLGAAPLPFGKVRIFIEGAPGDGDAASAFLGEDWGKFTPKDDEMRLYLGVAQDIVVKRTIARNETQRVAGNLFHQEVVLKYEIENFKKQAVTLDIAEDLRHVRNEVRGGGVTRDVEWEIRPDNTLPGPPDPEQSDHQRLLYHVELPAASPDGKAEKTVHTLSLLIKNEW